MSTVVAPLPAQLEMRSDVLQVFPVPGQGRGCFAARDVAGGSVVHREFPMLCAPPPGRADEVCYRCLAPRGMVVGAGVMDRGAWFCSDGCRADAGREWWVLERECELEPLWELCRTSGQKFPYMLVRLACRALLAACGGRLHAADSVMPARGQCAGTGDHGHDATAASGTESSAAVTQSSSMGSDERVPVGDALQVRPERRRMRHE